MSVLKAELIEELDFDLEENLNHDFNIGATTPISVIFSYENADDTDGELQVNVGNELGLTPAKSAYVMANANNLTDVEIVAINAIVPRINIVYTKNGNTAGTGKIRIYGGS
jgi:hypothetical protein